MVYFLEHPDAMDALTTEQIMALSRGESVANGDTEVKTEDSEGTPGPAVVDEVAAPEAKVESVLMAKDGRHIIPFERLTEMTEKAAEWERFAGEQAALIESLKAAKVEDAKTGGTEAQQAVMAEYQGEFPEVATDMKPYIQSMIDAGVSAKMSEMEAKLNTAMAPMQKAAADNAVDAHFAAIKDAVPEFDTLVETGAVQDWIKTQPSFMQGPALKILETGTAAQVIELFSAYKATLGTPKDVPAATKEDLKKQAAAVIANAKGKTPVSLTDIPSGAIAETNGLVAEMAMSASQLLDTFMKMSPDKILKHAARTL